MNLLITGALAPTDADLDQIASRGHAVAYLPRESDPLPCDPAWVEGVIANGLFLHHPIEDFPHLRYIQLTSAGFDRVPMDYAAARGICVRNAEDAYSIPMAEHALSGVLALCRGLPYYHDRKHARIWEKHRGAWEIFGKTVCIVGCGHAGTACATRFSALGCTVRGVDIRPMEKDAYASISPLSELDGLLAVSDIVILTLPLTGDTHHLFNAERFAHLRQGAIVVNIARGAVVDTPALIDALGTRLGGAVLDVFEEEPLDPASPLWEMEHVILTPHAGFIGDGNRERLMNVILKNLESIP